MLVPPSCDIGSDDCFFEGTEKRVEINFAGEEGDLLRVTHGEWEAVVKAAKTQVLSSMTTQGFTSFLLSESSLLVYPRQVVLKTCGTTVPLDAVRLMLALGEQQGLQPEWVCYSRKCFLRPARQPEEYRNSEEEIKRCRAVCDGIGDAFVLGPLTGDHWLLYNCPVLKVDGFQRQDVTFDMVMYGLAADVCRAFSVEDGEECDSQRMREASGLGQLFELLGGEVDDYSFSPCGYSANAHFGGAYAIIHVTPEHSCSFASFETNFGPAVAHAEGGASVESQLNELFGKVLQTFRPATLAVACFVDQGARTQVGAAPMEGICRQYHCKGTNVYTFDVDYTAMVSYFECRAKS